MRGLALCFFALSIAAAELPVAECPAGKPEAVVILVRHADRDGELLNEKGWERARALRDLVLGTFGRVDAVIATTVERTYQTLEPLLEDRRVSRRGVAVHRFDPHDYDAVIETIRRERARNDGKRPVVIVYAGHSDTVRPVLERLAPRSVREHFAEWFPCDGGICHSDYDDVWVATWCAGAEPELRKAEYGEATPAH